MLQDHNSPKPASSLKKAFDPLWKAQLGIHQAKHYSRQYPCGATYQVLKAWPDFIQLPKDSMGKGAGGLPSTLQATVYATVEGVCSWLYARQVMQF